MGEKLWIEQWNVDCISNPTPEAQNFSQLSKFTHGQPGPAEAQVLKPKHVNSSPLFL